MSDIIRQRIECMAKHPLVQHRKNRFQSEVQKYLRQGFKVKVNQVGWVIISEKKEVIQEGLWTTLDEQFCFLEDVSMLPTHQILC